MAMNRRKRLVLPLAMAGLVAASTIGSGQDASRPKVGYKDTPMLPGGRWHVHDSDRPFPPVVTPGTCSTQEEPGKPPSDAVVLFDGKDLSHWQSGRGGPARWTVRDGAMVVQPGAGESPIARTSSANARSTWSSPRPTRPAAATRTGATAASSSSAATRSRCSTATRT